MRRDKALFEVLKTRFDKNAHRHKGVAWAAVQARIENSPDTLRSLAEMERTGGEPDVIAHDKKTGELIFCDCSAESPAGRRSLCYDPEALKSRKENRPEGSATGMAASMGIELLTEEQYRALQQLGEFDLKTSSWVNDAPRYPATRRGALLRSALRHGVPLSQRRAVVLRRPGIPRHPASLKPGCLKILRIAAGKSATVRA